MGHTRRHWGIRGASTTLASTTLASTTLASTTLASTTALLAAGLAVSLNLAGTPAATAAEANLHTPTSHLPAATPRPSAGPDTMSLSSNFSYDLVTAEGGVFNFGGAGYFGNERWRHLAAPIVGMAVTPDGGGYWLVGANGAVFNLGDAGWYGSLAHVSLGEGQQVVSISPTRDGRGYWLINQAGAVFNFGDAQPIDNEQPLPAADLATPIVSAVVDPHALGAWLTDAQGHVYNTGAAPWYGSLGQFHLNYPITAIASIPSGLGYWLSNSLGDVWPFGSAAAGNPAQTGIVGSAVGLAPAEDRNGYWAVTNTGDIIPGGDAISRGEPSAALAQGSVVAIAPAPQLISHLPSQSIGYDINWPQCQTPGSSQTVALPGPPSYPAGTSKYTIAVVGVDGWATGPYNSCFDAEIKWAENATYPAGSGLGGAPPYDLYMFLNSPASNSTIDMTGPAGTCSNFTGATWSHCLAYNYGYNSAIDAVAFAKSQGASAKIWWLDIENDICAPGMWNDAANGEWWSCDLNLNAATIQAAIDALRSQGITAGIYCTAVQWAGITNSYTVQGGAPPIWIAGAPYSSPPYPASWGYPGPSIDTTYCTDTSYRFAGGVPVMLQETPGNGYAFDPDIAC
jgi:hypothetical protein